jgi:hypothetical protein
VVVFYWNTPTTGIDFRYKYMELVLVVSSLQVRDIILPTPVDLMLYWKLYQVPGIAITPGSFVLFTRSVKKVAPDTTTY